MTGGEPVLQVLLNVAVDGVVVWKVIRPSFQVGVFEQGRYFEHERGREREKREEKRREKREREREKKEKLRKTEKN